MRPTPRSETARHWNISFVGGWREVTDTLRRAIKIRKLPRDAVMDRRIFIRQNGSIHDAESEKLPSSVKFPIYSVQRPVNKAQAKKISSVTFPIPVLKKWPCITSPIKTLIDWIDVIVDQCTVYNDVLQKIQPLVNKEQLVESHEHKMITIFFYWKWSLYNVRIQNIPRLFLTSLHHVRRPSP